MSRRKSVEAFIQQREKLTEENVNDYEYYEVVDRETVPLYAAIYSAIYRHEDLQDLNEKNTIEKILELQPNLFLGLKDYDQEIFSETAIGLAYFHKELGPEIVKLLEEYMKNEFGMTKVDKSVAEEMWEEQKKPKEETWYRTKSITQKRLFPSFKF